MPARGGRGLRRRYGAITSCRLRHVVVDPELLVAAFEVPRGRCRKMLTVLAYGRWCEHVAHAWQAEQEAVQQFIEEGRTQGETRTVGGRDLREVKSAAHDVQTFLENAL